VSLNDVKFIKNAFGVTVNDVLVSALTAAFRYAYTHVHTRDHVLTLHVLRSYLLETDQELEDDILTAIPGNASCCTMPPTSWH
jgi:hypothetical protein